MWFRIVLLKKKQDFPWKNSLLYISIPAGYPAMCLKASIYNHRFLIWYYALINNQMISSAHMRTVSWFPKKKILKLWSIKPQKAFPSHLSTSCMSSGLDKVLLFVDLEFYLHLWSQWGLSLLMVSRSVPKPSHCLQMYMRTICPYALNYLLSQSFTWLGSLRDAGKSGGLFIIFV